MVLPRFILLKSNDKYLVNGVVVNGEYQAGLQFSDVGGITESNFQYMKFEVEKAMVEGDFVHIRSCYNNKYLVNMRDSSDLIVAAANEPEEDKTLFKPVLVGADGGDNSVAPSERLKIKLKYNNGYTRMSRNTGDYKFGATRDDASVFEVYNADLVVIFPVYVAFLGPNGHYVAHCGSQRGKAYMQFNAIDPSARNAVFKIQHCTRHREHGQVAVRIQNVDSAQYWAVSDKGDFIFADTSEGDSLREKALFIPEFSSERGKSVVALRSLSNGKYAKSSDGPHDMRHVLRAATSNLDGRAMFQVTEPVRSRSIDNVKFNRGDARIYNVTQVEKFTCSFKNDGNRDMHVSVKVSCKIFRTRTRNHCVSVNTSIIAHWTAPIPYLDDNGELQIPEHESNESFEWGKQKEIERDFVKTIERLTIKPGERVTIKVIATKAYFDVPFKCRVRDELPRGREPPYPKRGCLFVASNEYNFRIEGIPGDPMRRLQHQVGQLRLE